MDTREKYRQKGRKVWEGSRYIGVGIEFGICVVVCHYIGGKIDDHWGTGPWGGLVGIILGFGGGLMSLIRIAAKESKKTTPYKQESSTPQTSTPQTTQKTKDTH